MTIRHIRNDGTVVYNGKEYTTIDKETLIGTYRRHIRVRVTEDLVGRSVILHTVDGQFIANAYVKGYFGAAQEKATPYGVQTTGNDDILGPFKDEFEALKAANEINRVSVKDNHGRQQGDIVFLVATVCEWDQCGG